MKRLRDALLLCGFGVMLYGFWSWWAPLEWIAGGAGLCGGAVAWMIWERLARKAK